MGLIDNTELRLGTYSQFVNSDQDDAADADDKSDEDHYCLQFYSGFQ